MDHISPECYPAEWITFGRRGGSLSGGKADRFSRGIHTRNGDPPSLGWGVRDLAGAVVAAGGSAMRFAQESLRVRSPKTDPGHV